MGRAFPFSLAAAPSEGITSAATYDTIESLPAALDTDGEVYDAHASGISVPRAYKDAPHVKLAGDRLSILPGDTLADLVAGPWTNSTAGKAAKAADGPLTITGGSYGEWLTLGPVDWIGAGVKRILLGIKGSRVAGRPAVCIWSSPEEGGNSRGLWVGLYNGGAAAARIVQSNDTALDSADLGPVDYSADEPVWALVDWSQDDGSGRAAISWIRSSKGGRRTQISRASLAIIGGFNGHLWISPNLDVGGMGSLSLDWLLVLDATDVP